MALPYAAVVLAGGAARRLGGRDKPALPVGGLPMLHRVLAAVADARPRVVVGPPRPDLPPEVIAVREEPPGGGPVAALAAGLAVVPGSVPFTAVFAADLPWLTPTAVVQLRAGASTMDGALLVDDGGRAQLLCGVWRSAALRSGLAALGDPRGQSMRRLVGSLRMVEVTVSSGSGPPPWYDCDTDDDLRRAEEWLA